MSKPISLLSALLCTFIWGTTFIAQDTGMDNIGPFTFNAVRFFVGFLAKKPTKNLTALNVKGPILSIPVSWAIKVVPHIKVHNKALNREMGLDIFNYTASL